jgi:yeast amino acid transporter
MLEEEGANVLGRDSDEYKKKYYRAHWQPTCAITGLVGCTLVVLFCGWPAIYLLKERNTMSNASDLKGTLDLIGDITGAYSGVRPNIPLLDDTPSP